LARYNILICQDVEPVAASTESDIDGKYCLTTYTPKRFGKTTYPITYRGSFISKKALT